MTIVAGTDFSPGARRAARVAAAVARLLGRPMLLIHVVEGAFAARSLAHSGRRARRGMERLEAEVADLAEPGLEVAAELRAGAPDEVLARTVEEVDASLLVVSATGRSASRRWLLGSVTERLLQVAPLPVMVVRDGEPFLRWARGEEPLRLMAATDLAPGPRPALRWAVDWMAAGSCSLAAIHVAWPPEVQARLGVPSVGDRLDPEAERILTGQLRELVGDPPGPSTSRVVAGSGRVADVVLGLAAEERPHVLVTGTRRKGSLQRFWEGSVSRRLVHLAPMDVVCVPAPREEVAPPPGRIRRVLAATDLTPRGNRAAEYALSLLADGGVLHLLHVVNELSEPDVAERLASLVPPEGTRVQVRLETPFSADPAQAICQVAERLGVDALCLATRRRVGLARSLGVSVSRRVVERCSVPVLLVPTPQSSTNAWLGARARSEADW